MQTGICWGIVQFVDIIWACVASTGIAVLFHVRENAPETDTVLLQQLVNSSAQQESTVASSSPGLEDKRLRTLQKKLRQIQELKDREAKGEKLEASQVHVVDDMTICMVSCQLG